LHNSSEKLHELKKNAVRYKNWSSLDYRNQ